MGEARCGKSTLSCAIFYHPLVIDLFSLDFSSQELIGLLQFPLLLPQVGNGIGE